MHRRCFLPALRLEGRCDDCTAMVKKPRTLSTRATTRRPLRQPLGVNLIIEVLSTRATTRRPLRPLRSTIAPIIYPFYPRNDSKAVATCEAAVGGGRRGFLPAQRLEGRCDRPRIGGCPQKAFLPAQRLEGRCDVNPHVTFETRSFLPAQRLEGRCDTAARALRGFRLLSTRATTRRPLRHGCNQFRRWESPFYPRNDSKAVATSRPSWSRFKKSLSTRATTRRPLRLFEPVVAKRYELSTRATTRRPLRLVLRGTLPRNDLSTRATTRRPLRLNTISLIPVKAGFLPAQRLEGRCD